MLMHRVHPPDTISKSNPRDAACYQILFNSKTDGIQTVRKESNEDLHELIKLTA